ncbi:probable G-protein coupled receptor No18 [Hydractinia symbiolongicarpus]|uniref:probable G-protein coupled receptor No18 n=1 Tax=Hydractinia symbiolongicarpus TaxID=13093 RepID=UPI002550622D|nr:probable G-protein coupled receptor No18 [Hydractinia symbiolongicarpus]
MNDGLIYLIAVFSGIIFSVFNIITITVILIDRKLRSSITNRPILSFLVASTIQGLLPAPLYVYKRLVQSQHTSEWVCDVYRLLYFYCGHMMKISLVLVSIDRLLAVKYPFKYDNYITKARTTILIIFLCIVTLFVDTLPFYINVERTDECQYVPVRIWGLFVISLYTILPFFLILINYIQIWLVAARMAFKDKRLRERFHNDENENGSVIRNYRVDDEEENEMDKDEDEEVKMLKDRKKINYGSINSIIHIKANVKFAFEMKATRTSLALIAVYVFCWGPLGVFYMIDHFCYNCLSDDDDLKLTRAFVKLLSFSSSILAPIVYCWWNRDFKKAAQRLCVQYCCLKVNREKQRRQSPLTQQTQHLIETKDTSVTSFN